MTPEFEKAIAPVREWLVQGAPGNIAFDMNEVHCGTAMCIAGAIMEFNKLDVRMAATTLGEDLGMTVKQIYQLFFGHTTNEERTELSKITPAMAVDAIDQMLATGEVNWRTDV